MAGSGMSVHLHTAQLHPSLPPITQHLVHCDGDDCEEVADHARIVSGWIMVTYYRDDTDDMQRELHFCSQTCARFHDRAHVWSQPQVNNPHRRTEQKGSEDASTG